jgi:cell division control protein 45
MTGLIESKDLVCYIFDSQRPYIQNYLKSTLVRVFDESLSAEDQDAISSDPERREMKPRRLVVESDSTGVFFAAATSGVIYSLARELNRASLELLWLWIVGLTDQLLHSKIDRVDYEGKISACINEVVSHPANIYKVPSRVEDDSCNFEIQTEQKPVSSVFIEHKDLRIMLYRHWSLYDSLYHSNYIASRLGIWKEPGKNKLNEILAQIGIPLQECKQQYRFMKSQFKATLREKLPLIGSQYDIDDLFITTCVRQYSRKRQYSASDVVYAISALFEYPGLLEDTDEEVTLQDKWLRNFWTAHDALLEEGKLEQGIKLAIELQKAVIQQGTALIEKKVISPANEFRYAIISSDSINQIKFFHHPLAIKKLNCFIQEAYQSLRTNVRPKPMVLCVFNSSRNTYFVCGVISKLQDKNDFGWRFHEAAEAVQADFRRDFFEDAYIEVKKEHFQAFIEKLTNEDI